MPDAREGAPRSAGKIAGLSVAPDIGADGNPEADERERIDRARAGDSEAQAWLFDEHYSRVFGYLRTRLALPQDAEDLAMEVFMRMLDALPRYNYRGVPFISWLMRIASNLAKDYYRERGTSTRTVSLADDLDVDAGEDPARQVELQISIAEIGDAMQHLTELEREVIRLRYAAELSIAETAAALEKSENNIKQLTHKALVKLRKALGSENA